MLQVIGGILIILISSLFLWAYTYKPPYNMFFVISFSAFLILGIAQTIVGIAHRGKE